MSETKKSCAGAKDGALSRRTFVKAGVAGVAGAVYWVAPSVASPTEQVVNRLAIVSAIGETLIPSAAGDPGYRELEPHGITEEVLKGLTALSDDLLDALNVSAGTLFDSRTLLELTENEKREYLEAIIGGGVFTNSGISARLQSTYRLLRVRILTVYYQNFPENVVAKDGHGIPLAEDLHQISNPNSKQLVTGWDVANYPGPVTWEEEEQLRARMKGILWEE